VTGFVALVAGLALGSSRALSGKVSETTAVVALLSVAAIPGQVSGLTTAVASGSGTASSEPSPSTAEPAPTASTRSTGTFAGTVTVPLAVVALHGTTTSSVTESSTGSESTSRSSFGAFPRKVAGLTALVAGGAAVARVGVGAVSCDMSLLLALVARLGPLLTFARAVLAQVTRLTAVVAKRFRGALVGPVSRLLAIVTNHRRAHLDAIVTSKPATFLKNSG